MPKSNTPAADATPDWENYRASPADDKLWRSVIDAAKSAQDTIEALREGANPNFPDGIDQTPLHMAARHGDAAKVSALLQAGAGLDARDGLKETPLHWAARHGNEATSAALLAAGADPTAVNFERHTPRQLMHKAARWQGAGEQAIGRIDAILGRAEARAGEPHAQIAPAPLPGAGSAEPHPLSRVTGFSQNADGTWTERWAHGSESYREGASGTFYNVKTPSEVVALFEQAMADWAISKVRPTIRVFYGDPQTGLDQLETHGVHGFLGRSPSPFKRPLLAHGKLEPGSVSILDAAIVRLQVNGVDRWSAPNYHQGFLVCATTDDPRRPFAVLRNGANPANFTREEDRSGWLRFIRGETHSIRQAPRPSAAAEQTAPSGRTPLVDR